MIRFSLLALTALLSAVWTPAGGQDAAMMAPPEPSNMVSLFNGKDLENWSGDPRLWSVRDGVIRGETTDEVSTTGNTFLIWQGGAPADFELRFVYRCSTSNNSGLQYRSKHITEPSARNAWVVRGYQHEMRNELDLPNVSGFIYDEGSKRGRVCLVGEKAVWTADGKKEVVGNLIDAESFKKLFKLDDWNESVIIARGNHIRHYINGRLVVDFTDEDPNMAHSEGVIALQLHAGKPMWTEFKSIRLAELN